MQLFENICANKLAKLLQNGNERPLIALLKNSVFYYCSGKDPTPIVAFDSRYPLYVYADLVGYGRGDFTVEIQTLLDRLATRGFTVEQRQDVVDASCLGNCKNAVVVQLSVNKQGKKQRLLLLYVQNDAVDTYKHLYQDNKVLPTCICNYRYEMTRRGCIEQAEKLVQYVFGHCFDNNYHAVGVYPYYGDYAKGEVKLFKQGA